MRTKTDKREIEYVSLDRLTPYARNSRTHSPEQVKQIAASIREFGFTNPVLIDAEGTIIAGHGRVMAAEHLQLETVPCIRLDYLTEAQKRAYVIADNKLALNADWDTEMLKVELDELHGRDYDLSLLGFDAVELEDLMQLSLDDKQLNEDVTPEPPVQPITNTGDIWQLGKHRVMCGDSTNQQDVARLLNGLRIELCFTSPPYALGKSAKLSGNKMSRSSGNAYDAHDDKPEDWYNLMSKWFEVSTSYCESWLVNVQMLAGNKRELIRWLNDNRDRLVDLLVWDKGHAAPPMQQGVLTSSSELLICYGKHNASRVIPFSSWHGTQSSVYKAPPQRNNEYADVHGATMPLHLPAWVIGELCDKAQTIYEPFAGTGTTLIAAEQLGRTCYGMEISPAYCDVIVQRWETLTGNKAERING